MLLKFALQNFDAAEKKKQKNKKHQKEKRNKNVFVIENYSLSHIKLYHFFYKNR